jgi:hypothetical protein
MSSESRRSACDGAAFVRVAIHRCDDVGSRRLSPNDAINANDREPGERSLMRANDKDLR